MKYSGSRPLHLIPLALAAILSTQAAAQPAPPSGALTLFRDRNFAGPSITLREANSSTSFSPRSARVSGGAWLVCERPFFGGRCYELKADTAKLTLHRSFSGMVRSARPVALPAPEQSTAAPKPPASSPEPADPPKPPEKSSDPPQP